MKKLFDEIPRIESERIILKEVTETDAPEIKAFAEDREAFRYLPTFLLEQKDPDINAAIEGFYGDAFNNKESLMLGIYQKTDEKWCGFIEFYGYSDERHKVSVGCRLAQRAWGQGIGTEALSLALKYLFGETDIEVVTASVMADNTASNRMAEKCGFLRTEEYAKEDWGFDEPAIVHKYVRIKTDQDFYSIIDQNTREWAEKSGIKISNDASDFVLVTDVVPDAILEIRYYSTYNFIGARVDGYEEPIALMTKESAEALKGVSNEMVEKGYRLKIYDAYRPQKAVAHFVRWALQTHSKQMKEYFYPELEKENIFPLGFIAEKSGHSRGSTVDLTLFDMKTNKELDMGGAFDFFGDLSHPAYTDVTEEQYANRMLLQDVMVKHGFRPLVEEWWHFTLENEPYPDTYFTFPVNSKSVGK